MIEPDLNRLTADLATLVALRSESPWESEPRPGFREREIADWLLAAMTELGLEVHQAEVHPDRPNIWGYRRGEGNGPTLMLCAHMDTVGVEGYDGDPFEPWVADGRLHGRGSCDMKGAIACFLETIRVLQDETLAGDLLLLFVADEEHSMTGSAHAGRHGPSADFAIVAEPTKLAICPKHKGEYCGRISVQGRAAHTSMPENGHNAILDMMAIIQGLDAYGRDLLSRPAHAMCGTGRCTVSTIKGGTGVSSVPDHCEIEFDRRILPGESLDDLLSEFEAILATARADRPQLQAQLERNSLYIPALDTAIDGPLTQAAILASETVLQAPAKVQSFPACTDAPNLGIPSIILGPGDLARAHTIDEWIELSDLPKAVAIYADMARRMLG